MSSNPSKKIVVAVDLDEVVYRYCDGLRDWLRIERGIVVPDEEPSSWSMSEAGWFNSTEEYQAAHGEAVDDGLYTKLELYPDAAKTLWGMSKAGYSLNIITSRFVLPGQNQKVVEQTVQALDRDRIPYDNISFLSDKTLQFADAYIDDSPRNVSALLDCGRFVICRTMSYNQATEAPVRATTWAETRQILRDKFGR